MSNENNATDPRPAREGVPAELVEKVHQANENFSRARHRMEEAQGVEEAGGLVQRDRAADELRDAEKELEKLDEQIHREFTGN